MIFAHCKKTFTFWGIISIASWHYTEWIWKDLAIFYSSHCCAVLSNVRLFVTPYAVAFSVHGDFPGKNTGVGCHTILRGSSQPRDQTQVSRIAGRFFTSWATREAVNNPLLHLLSTFCVFNRNAVCKTMVIRTGLNEMAWFLTVDLGDFIYFSLGFYLKYGNSPWHEE